MSYIKRFDSNISHQEQKDLRGGGRPSLKLNVDAKKPKGKAPIPNDIWKLPSPKPNPGKPWKTKKKIKCKMSFKLIHCPQVMLYGVKLTMNLINTGSGNGLLSIQCQVISRINADLLSAGPVRTKLSEIWMNLLSRKYGCKCFWTISAILFRPQHSNRIYPFCECMLIVAQWHHMASQNLINIG